MGNRPLPPYRHGNGYLEKKLEMFRCPAGLAASFAVFLEGSLVMRRLLVSLLGFLASAKSSRRKAISGTLWTTCVKSWTDTVLRFLDPATREALFFFLGGVFLRSGGNRVFRGEDGKKCGEGEIGSDIEGVGGVGGLSS